MSLEEESALNMSTNTSSHGKPRQIVGLRKFMPLADQNCLKQILPSVNKQFQQAAKFNARLTMYSNSNSKQINKFTESSYFNKGAAKNAAVPLSIGVQPSPGNAIKIPSHFGVNITNHNKLAQNYYSNNLGLTQNTFDLNTSTTKVNDSFSNSPQFNHIPRIPNNAIRTKPPHKHSININGGVVIIGGVGNALNRTAIEGAN
mmetsp:Transcript_33921/g.24961  ORF Transcript_33921/g.24961 Transcript_33921/m.24961 type:complete len:202 (+) Transcript_33921:1895-2500(+)